MDELYVIIGSDHGGFELKEIIKAHLNNHYIKYYDIGCYDEESCDYPNIAEKLCIKLINETNTKKANLNHYGILICGTGIGISMAANKIKNIRCALCHNEFTARMSRKHNNANVLALGGRTTGVEIAKSIVNTFLNEKFEGGRHIRRISIFDP
jgi:ribose 5-phosphate isomerase B